MLLKEEGTAPAVQIATKEMMAPDLGDNALPGAADEGDLQGGRRVEQIGQSACEKLIESLLDGVEITGRGAVIIYDLNLRVPEMFMAYVAQRDSYNFPVIYVGCCDHATTLEWFDSFATVSWLPNMVTLFVFHVSRPTIAWNLCTVIRILFAYLSLSTLLGSKSTLRNGLLAATWRTRL